MKESWVFVLLWGSCQVDVEGIGHASYVITGDLLGMADIIKGDIEVVSG